MKLDVDRGVVSALYISGKNLIFPWGIETADFSSFFSLENGVGYRYSSIRDVLDFDDTHFRREIVCDMRHGKWSLECEDRIVSEFRIARAAKITAIEDSFLMDFVVRFRIRKKYVTRAMIAGRSFVHAGTNIYYQYPTREAFLDTSFGRVRIGIEEFDGAGRFSPFMYVRDRGEEWIIHARLLPDPPTHTTIKLCNSFFKTRPIPQWMTEEILKSKSIRDALWYRGERRPYASRALRWLNPCAFGLSMLPKGSSLELKCGLEFVNNDN